MENQVVMQLCIAFTDGTHCSGYQFDISSFDCQELSKAAKVKINSKKHNERNKVCTANSPKVVKITPA